MEAVTMPGIEPIFNQMVDLGRYWVIHNTRVSDPVINNAVAVVAGLTVTYVAAKTKVLAQRLAGRITTRFARNNYITGPMTDEQRTEHQKICPRPEVFTVMVQTSEQRLMDDVTRWAMRTYPVTRFSNAVYTTLQTWGTSTAHQQDESVSTDNDLVSKVRTTFSYFAAWQAHGDVLYLHYNSNCRRLEFLCQKAECLRSFQTNFKDPSPEEIAAIAAKARAEVAAKEAKEAKEAEEAQQRLEEQARVDAEASLDAAIVIGKYKLPPKASLGEQRYSIDLLKLYRAQKFVVKDAQRIDRRWTLDAMVFPGKEKLLSLVRNFRRSLASPDPYACSKIGVMSAGSIGTGKSTIGTAIANTLGYNIATADLSDPDLDADEFAKAIVFATSLKFIIEFDEFDKLLAIMRSQASSPEQRAIRYKAELERLRVIKEQLKDAGDEEASATAQANYVRMLQQERKKPLELGVFQSIMDGQGDSSGRIIVATTNVPRDIPSALMREGRFDIKLEMVNMTADGIRELLRLIYGWQGDPQLPGVPATSDLVKLSDSDEENETDDPNYYVSINKAKRLKKWNKLRAQALEGSSWKDDLSADFEWLDGLDLPDGVWSPAQVVSAHRTHLRLRATATYLANERPVQFCGTYLKDIELPTSTKPIDIDRAESISTNTTASGSSADGRSRSGRFAGQKRKADSPLSDSIEEELFGDEN